MFISPEWFVLGAGLLGLPYVFAKAPRRDNTTAIERAREDYATGRIDLKQFDTLAGLLVNSGQDETVVPEANWSSKLTLEQCAELGRQARDA